jgi:hypothetical protein
MAFFYPLRLPSDVRLLLNAGRCLSAVVKIALCGRKTRRAGPQKRKERGKPHACRQIGHKDNQLFPHCFSACANHLFIEDTQAENIISLSVLTPAR